jgi:malate/lactate dehydrogenase
MKVSSIAIIGAGRVGASAAFALVMAGYRNIHLFDIDTNRVMGEARDLCDAVGKHDAADAWTELDKADIYVVSAGKPRTADMSRQDLYEFNRGVCEPIFEKIAKLNPDARVIVISNPSDEIAELAKKRLKHVITAGSVLDARRAEIVFGRPVKLGGTHSKRVIEDIREPERLLEESYHGRAAETIRLKGCTQWGIASEVLSLVNDVVNGRR